MQARVIRTNIVQGFESKKRFYVQTKKWFGWHNVYHADTEVECHRWINAQNAASEAEVIVWEGNLW
jgi:hypothetical protein